MNLPISSLYLLGDCIEVMFSRLGGHSCPLPVNSLIRPTSTKKLLVYTKSAEYTPLSQLLKPKTGSLLLYCTNNNSLLSHFGPKSIIRAALKNLFSFEVMNCISLKTT